jgi:hypothetical protein
MRGACCASVVKLTEAKSPHAVPLEKSIGAGVVRGSCGLLRFAGLDQHRAERLLRAQ